jgi:hypothetical protein
VGGRGAREARTHFEVIELLPADSFVEARLETGRTHQIRAHFAAIGHAVCADPRYGGAGRHGLDRQFLHSARLAFTHPFTGEKLDLGSGLPDEVASHLRAQAERLPARVLLIRRTGGGATDGQRPQYVARSQSVERRRRPTWHRVPQSRTARRATQRRRDRAGCSRGWSAAAHSWLRACTSPSRGPSGDRPGSGDQDAWQRPSRMT